MPRILCLGCALLLTTHAARASAIASTNLSFVGMTDGRQIGIALAGCSGYSGPEPMASRSIGELARAQNVRR